MQKRSWLFLSGTFFCSAVDVPLRLLAEDKIQAFVNPNGRVVFTNLVDNAPAPVTPVLTCNGCSGYGNAGPAASAGRHHCTRLTASIPALVRAVMKTESNFNRWAVSPKGALGLMQLIPATGRRYGVRDFFDPQQNIEGGVRYLKFLLEKFNGNLDLSLAAYNAGENLVERLGRIPPIPETTNYVRKIRAIIQEIAMPLRHAPVMIARRTAPQIFRSTDEQRHCSLLECRTSELMNEKQPQSSLLRCFLYSLLAHSRVLPRLPLASEAQRGIQVGRGPRRRTQRKSHKPTGRARHYLKVINAYQRVYTHHTAHRLRGQCVDDYRPAVRRDQREERCDSHPEFPAP